MPQKSIWRAVAQPRWANGCGVARTVGFADAASRSGRRIVEEVVDLARGFGIHARHMLQVGNRRALDRLQGAEMAQQRTFSCRPDTGDFLQSGLADVFLAFLAVRTDRETMRLVAHPLHEIQHRIARLELDRLAAGNEEGLA